MRKTEEVARTGKPPMPGWEHDLLMATRAYVRKQLPTTAHPDQVELVTWRIFNNMRRTLRLFHK